MNKNSNQNKNQQKKIRVLLLGFLADAGFRFDSANFAKAIQKIRSIKDLIFETNNQRKSAGSHSKNVANQNFSRDFSQLDAANSNICNFDNINLRQGQNVSDQKSINLSSDQQNQDQEKSEFNSATRDFLKNKSSNPQKLSDSKNSISESSPESLRESLGEILKKSRIDQDLSTQQISSVLKVSHKDILALENNEIEKITHLSYLRGLALAYGRMLKIDAKQIESKLKEFDFKSNTELKDHKLINMSKAFDLRPSKDVFLKFLVISLVVYFGFLIFFGSLKNKSEVITIDKIVFRLSKIKSDKDSKR